jgi:hypothetical protein
MAEKEGQPLIKGGVPLFEWRPNASVEDFVEEDVESADEYEHFQKIFSIRPNPTMMLSRNLTAMMILKSTTTMLPSQMMMQLMIPPFLSLIPMILGLLDLIPTLMKVPRETKLPETMFPIRPWRTTQTKIWVPIGTISGATEADPTATDLIAKWMIP